MCQQCVTRRSWGFRQALRSRTELTRFESWQEFYGVVALNGSKIALTKHSKFSQRLGYSLAASPGRKISAEHDLVRVHEFLERRNRSWISCARDIVIKLFQFADETVRHLRLEVACCTVNAARQKRHRAARMRPYPPYIRKSRRVAAEAHTRDCARCVGAIFH